MTVKDAAERLGLHASSVYDLIASGELPHRRVGPRRGKIVIDSVDVDTYWEKSKRFGHAPVKGKLKHFTL